MVNNINLIIIISVIVVFISMGLIERFSEIPPRKLFFGVFYLTIGLLISSLLSVPLSNLPEPYGSWAPIIATIIVVSILSAVFWRKHNTLDKWLTEALKSFAIFRALNLGGPNTIMDVVVDTSVLIDARIIDIVHLGFMPYKLIIPRFVLNELQNIADSTDSDRRARGRRGLEIVDKLRKEKEIKIDISNENFDVEEVDRKLISLTKKTNAALLTTDYNLNKLATAEGVKVLNINELAQSLRPVILPGEELEVKVVHLGKEKAQGVGYMPDGTMIVVERGDKLLDKSVRVKVTRALQTAAGKMFFAKVINGD